MNRLSYKLLYTIILYSIIIGYSISNYIVYGYDISKKNMKELTASWYSVESLKKEGTYEYSKGVMANGKQFKDEGFTAASRDFPLGTCVKVTSIVNGRSINVKITDRISKRFRGKRIDLSKRAFSEIAGLEQGLCKVYVEEIK